MSWCATLSEIKSLRLDVTEDFHPHSSAFPFAFAIGLLTDGEAVHPLHGVPTAYAGWCLRLTLFTFA